MKNEITKLIETNLKSITARRTKFVQKEDGSFVSEGDLLCDKILREYFKKRYPHLIYITEEAVRPNFDTKGSYAIVDPIDGTENFISGLPIWGIGISIWEKGEHQFSMILLPELAIYISTDDDAQKIEYFSRIHGLSSSLNETLFLKEIEGKREVRIFGCCMFSMYLLVNSSLTSFSNPVGANAWDILPGIMIAQKNGLNILVNDKEYRGEILNFNKKYKFKIWK